QDRDGAVTRYVYRSWNLLHQKIDPLERTTTYEHSIRTRTTRITDPNGTVHEYGYDPWDRLIEVRRHGRVRERYRYDTADNLVEKTDGAGRPLLTFELAPGNLKAARQLAG